MIPEVAGVIKPSPNLPNILISIQLHKVWSHAGVQENGKACKLAEVGVETIERSHR